MTILLRKKKKVCFVSWWKNTWQRPCSADVWRVFFFYITKNLTVSAPAWQYNLHIHYMNSFRQSLLCARFDTSWRNCVNCLTSILPQGPVRTRYPPVGQSQMCHLTMRLVFQCRTPSHIIHHNYRVPIIFYSAALLSSRLQQRPAIKL